MLEATLKTCLCFFEVFYAETAFEVLPYGVMRVCYTPRDKAHSKRAIISTRESMFGILVHGIKKSARLFIECWFARSLGDGGSRRFLERILLEI